MEKCTTMEEYILNDLYSIKEKLELTTLELDAANKKLTEIHKAEEKQEQELSSIPGDDNLKCIYLSDKPYYYYDVRMESLSSWNKLLIKKNETPELVEKARNDPESFKKLCSLQYGYDGPVGKITESIYNYLLKLRNGYELAIEITKSGCYTYGIGEAYGRFLTKEEAEEYLKEEVLKKIDTYLEKYKDQFEEVKANEDKQN